MKNIKKAVLAGALVWTAGSTSPATAQDQETKPIQCVSNVGQRQSCPVGGEVLNVGVTGIYGETPCILGYTWGFEENGIWVGNGCSGTFDVTVISEEQQQQATPDLLRERLRKARKSIRKLRADLTKERDERQLIEGELSEAQAELAEIEETNIEARKQREERRKRPVNWSYRSIAACGNKAIREGKKRGAEQTRIAEIISARPSEGAWLVIGRLVSTFRGNKESERSYFRCWVGKGKVQSFNTEI